MFRMTVADVFFIKGRGLVATGKVEEGALRAGDELQVNGERTLKVDAIEAFRRVVDEAKPGDNIGVLFARLEREDVKSGDVLTGGRTGPTVSAESIGLEG